MTTVPDKVQMAYGALPAGWRLEKLKFFSDVRNSNVDKTIADDEEPVRLCNYVDVYYNNRITPDLDFMQGSATEAEIEKFQLKQGQVIITKDSEGWDDIGIPALVTEDMPDVLCGYHLSVLEPGQQLDGGFLAWLCRSEPLNDQFKLGANGVTRYGLGQYPMKNAFVALPPLETQRRIARFLDERTARIDGLIEKKRALLDRLAEKRQALITRAVTKGLNPSAPMKPSGIDWLGDIPAHWELKRLSFVTDVIDCKHRTPEYIDDGIPLVSTSEIKPFSIDYATKRQVSEEEFELMSEGGRRPTVGDIIYSRNASVGSAALVKSSQRLCLGQDLCIIRPKIMNSDFLEYFLNSGACLEQLNSEIVGATFKRVNVDVIKKYFTLQPPIEEQQMISSQLTADLNSEAAMWDKVEQSVNRLIEYRSSLITSAVTGSIAGLQ